MVTLAGTQNLNEFELHARAILGMPIPTITQVQNGASAVVLAQSESAKAPIYEGLDLVLTDPKAEVRIFGKPSTRPYRRMAVVLRNGTDPVEDLVRSAKGDAAKIRIKE